MNAGRPGYDKGLPKKAFANQQLALFMFWLPEVANSENWVESITVG